MLYKKNILEIKSKGYSIINNFLNEQEINYFKKFVGSIHLEKRLRKEKIFYSKNNFDFKNFRYFFLNKKLFKLIKKNNLQKISSEISNKNTELSYIDGYFSEISSNFILDWHVDRAYSGNLNPKKLLNPNDYAIKCIIYLDDVFSKTGQVSLEKVQSQKVPEFIFPYKDKLHVICEGGIYVYNHNGSYVGISDLWEGSLPRIAQCQQVGSEILFIQSGTSDLYRLNLEGLTISAVPLYAQTDGFQKFYISSDKTKRTNKSQVVL